MSQIKQLIEENWSGIKNSIRLENELTDIAYNIWLSPLEFHDYENNVLTILIPTSSTEMMEYIEKNYTNYFREAMFSLFNENMKVVFIIEDPDKNEKDEKEAVSEEKNATESYTLNPKYRFENFIVAGNNNLAHSACLHVAESPGKDFNPLFIYGGSGLGKTHLITAIGHYIIENSNKKVLYVTSEQFTSELVDSLKTRSMSLLKEKYRNTDVLLIDDIQFLIGRQSTQEEFFHTFNDLINAGKAVVITSDRPPGLMKELDERYRSRFASGLPVDIQPPSYETRVAILKNYAGIIGCDVSDEIIKYIAENIKSNIRQLEGALNQICAKPLLDPTIGEIDIDAAKEILKDTISLNGPLIVTPQIILEAVSDYYRVPTEDIVSKKRNADIVLPRQVFMYLCREMTEYTLKGIAVILDKKDHSTVLHGIKKIEDDLKMDMELRAVIEQIKENILSQ